MFADLHCHPGGRAFNRLKAKRNNKKLESDDYIWYISPTDLGKKQTKLEEQGKRAVYPQSNFDHLSKGDVRLVFAALYPLERGFVTGNKAAGLGSNIVRGLLEQLLQKPTFVRTLLGKILQPLNPLLSDALNNEGEGRDFMQSLVMNYHGNRIDYVQSSNYNYWNDLQDEHDLYIRCNMRPPQVPAPDGTRLYEIATHGADVAQIINNRQRIAVVLTLEGMHAISMKPDPVAKNGLSLVDEATLKNRIQTLKSWNLFFVTFSHHFTNGLCGHAHSLVYLVTQISDQSENMNGEFVPPLGMMAVRELLSIADNQLVRDSAKGKRILIDLKHTAAKSRKQFYDLVVKYNQLNPGDQIPIIASHVDHSGIKTLQQLIDHADHEADDDFNGGFYNWNINICDEDIKYIVESKGLIGLCFDQRIAGQPSWKPQAAAHDSALIVFKNIFRMVMGAKEQVTNAPEIWKCLTLGTDFDGFVDPVDAFPTSAHFGLFRIELTRILNALLPENKAAIFLDGDKTKNHFTVDEAVERICFTNALEFVTTHH